MMEAGQPSTARRLGPVGVSVLFHIGVLALAAAIPAALGAGRLASTGLALVPVSIILDGSSLALSNEGGRMTGGSAASASAEHALSRRQAHATDDGRDGAGRSDDNGELEAALARAVAGDGASVHYYTALVRQRLSTNQRAPVSPPRNGGTVRIRFRVERDGRVDAAWIARRSGSAALDNAAVEAVWRASPLPPVPADLPAPMEIEAPIAFDALQRTAQIEARP